ncbi:hypothetical protein GCM10027073_15800 [Streptomyces chlorus]
MQVEVPVVGAGAVGEVDLREQAARAAPDGAGARHARPVVDLLGARPAVHLRHVTGGTGGVPDVGGQRGQRPVGPVEPRAEVLHPRCVRCERAGRAAGGPHPDPAGVVRLEHHAQFAADARSGGDGFAEQHLGQYRPRRVEITGFQHPPDHVEERAARQQAHVAEPVLVDDEVGRLQSDLCFDAGTRTEHDYLPWAVRQGPDGPSIMGDGAGARSDLSGPA